MDLFLVNCQGFPIYFQSMSKRIIFSKWEFSLGSESQAVFPSASQIITTNKESAAGDSADDFVNDAWSRLESSCSSTSAGELQYELKDDFFVTKTSRWDRVTQ